MTIDFMILHYAFDKRMGRQFPEIPFERYADAVICHCRNERQAKDLLDAIKSRLAECRLKRNLQKTRDINCKGSDR